MRPQRPPLRIRRLPEPPIDRLNALKEAARRVRPDLLDFGQAIPDFGPPPEAVAALSSRLETTHRYVSDLGIPALRQAVTARLTARGSGGVVVMTAGANHAIFLALSALVRPADRVVLPAPYFLNHAMAIDAVGARKVMPSTAVDEIVRAIQETRPRAVLICNPSNPTGQVLREDALRQIADAARAVNTWILADEVYADFDGGTPIPPASAFAPERTLSFGSFSKSFGMTGWRLGWVQAPEAMIPPLACLQDLSLICAPHAAQILGLAALELAPDWPRRFHHDLAARREAVLRGLGGLPEVSVGEGAFFAWLRLPGIEDAEAAAPRLMEQAGICLTPGGSFGAPSWFRLSYGSRSILEVEEGCRRLMAWVRS